MFLSSNHHIRKNQTTKIIRIRNNVQNDGKQEDIIEQYKYLSTQDNQRKTNVSIKIYRKNEISGKSQEIYKQTLKEIKEKHCEPKSKETSG